MKMPIFPKKSKPQQKIVEKHVFRVLEDEILANWLEVKGLIQCGKYDVVPPYSNKGARIKIGLSNDLVIRRESQKNDGEFFSCGLSKEVKLVFINDLGGQAFGVVDVDAEILPFLQAKLIDQSIREKRVYLDYLQSILDSSTR